MDSIKEQIFQLENDLIKSEVRKSAEKGRKLKNSIRKQPQSRNRSVNNPGG